MNKLEILKKIDHLVAIHVMDINVLQLGYLSKHKFSEKEIKAAKEGKPVIVPKDAIKDPPKYVKNPDLPPPTIHDLANGSIGSIPSYSLDILSSWRIVNKFSHENIPFKMEHLEQNKWTVWFGDISVTCKTLSLAICLASLKYKKIDLEFNGIPSDL